MEKEQRKNVLGSQFEKCDSAYVFDQVRRHLSSGEARSLWRRIESEMQQGGVGAADTYLRSSFTELVQDLNETATHFQESLEERGVTNV